MKLDPTPLQQEFVEAVTRLLERECDPARVRSAEATGFDAALWSAIVELGIPVMGLAEDNGGMGASLLDIGLLAECHGRFLAPVPLLETVVGYRALERCGNGEAINVLRRLVGTGAPLAIALGGRGVADERLAAAGAAACAVIALEGDALTLFEHASLPPRLPNLGALPLARRSSRNADCRVTLLEGPEAAKVHERMIFEWQVLTASALAGLGQAGLDLGVRYAKERQAFDQPIGAFQAVSHRLADAATQIEGARLISRAAAAAARDEPARFPVFATMALAWCAEAAQHATADSLHVHGGYGFTLEYDIQLYVRRAKAWPLVLGNPAERYVAIAAAIAAQPERLKQWISS